MVGGGAEAGNGGLVATKLARPALAPAMSRPGAPALAVIAAPRVATPMAAATPRAAVRRQWAKSDGLPTVQIPSTARVFGPAQPTVSMPFSSCRSRTAASVIGP